MFVATTSSEGTDRRSLNLQDNGNALVSAVAAANPNTIVVAATPGALLTPWAKEIKALLVNFMPGQEGGNAIADLLFGDVNPSGKLPLTFPNVDNEVNFTKEMYPGTFPDHGNPSQQEASYSEKLLVGYRWYDAHKVAPAFPFGHGLSFTTFHYSELQSSTSAVSLTLTNNGSAGGAEVVQLYLSFPAAAGEPPQQLKGFQKVYLQPGEKAQVTLKLSPRDFSIWSVAAHSWQVVSGAFGVAVGSSSRDHRLTGTIEVL